METVRLGSADLDTLLNNYTGRKVLQIDGARHMKLVVNQKWIALYVHFNAFGKVYRKHLGRYPDCDIDTYRRSAERYYFAVKNGSISHARMRLDNLFLNIYVPYAKSNKQTYKLDIGRYRDYVHSVIGELYLDEIRPHHVQKLLDDLPSSLAPATINRIRSLIHKLFALAVENQLIFQNPCSPIKPKRENNVNERFLSSDEVQAFTRVAMRRMLEGEVAAGALLLALYTGARIGNVVSMKHEYIQDDGKSLLLPMTKSGKPQHVPLGGQARGVLKIMREFSSNEYVFSSVKGVGHLSYPKAQFRSICREAAISVRGCEHDGRSGFSPQPVTIHALRKTFASQVLANTGDLYLCSKLLGHSNVSVTMRYAFHSNNSQRSAVETLFSE